MDAAVALPSPAVASPSLAETDAPFEALDLCHRQILRMLDRLSQLLEHLERVGWDTEAQSQAREIHAFFSSTARNHHLDEELHIFPKLLQSEDAELVQATRCLRQDHGWLEEDWRELAPKLEAVATGYSWFDLYELRLMIPVFVALYHDHVALEESLIYPEARARLNRLELQGMGREMAARRRAPAAQQTG